MRIRKRGEVPAVESRAARPSNKLDAFIDVKMMFSKILAHQDLREMLHGSCAKLRPRGRNCGHVKQRNRWPRLVLRKQFVFEPRSGIAQPCGSSISLDWIVE